MHKIRKSRKLARSLVANKFQKIDPLRGLLCSIQTLSNKCVMKKSDLNTSSTSLVLTGQTGLSVKSSDRGVAERMVSELLDLARQSSAKQARKKVRLGSMELCEPDYAQIVNWADRLGCDPVSLLTDILGFSDFDGNKSRIVDGTLVELVWNGDLPLESFAWEAGLQLTKLTIINRMPSGYAQHKLPSLRILNAFGLDLSELDLSPFPNLEMLRCDQNVLTQLQLAATPKLIHLDCCDNELFELDLSCVPNLRTLNCAANNLHELSLSAALSLEEVCCSLNQIWDLDASENIALVSLNCESNYLENLPLPLHSRLQKLVCGNNNLKVLDLTGCDALESLWCERNVFEEINIGPCPALHEIKCYPDQFQPFHLTGLWEIAHNWSREHGMTRLEVTVDNSGGLMNKRYWWTGGPLSYRDVCLCVLHEIKIVYEWA